MNMTMRQILFALGAVAVFCILNVAMTKLPPPGSYAGPYGDIVMSRVQQDRHTGQGVSAVTFDYRGVDTMGEEFILFCAVAGVVMLLRVKKEETQEKKEEDGCDHGPPPPPPGPAVVTLGTILFPVGLVLGISMVLHGHLTPGGGFQGGVLCASAFLFIYLTGEFEDYERMTPDGTVEYLEAAGAVGYVVTGLASLIAGAAFLTNLLPLGQQDKLLSAGFLPVLNVAVGAEVTGGILLILTAFLRQALKIRRGGLS